MTELALSDYQETSDEDLITFTMDNKGLPQSVIYIHSVLQKDSFPTLGKIMGEIGWKEKCQQRDVGS